MQKVTVSQEASDGKWNRRMPEKRGSLVSIRNFLCKLLSPRLKETFSLCCWWKEHVHAVSKIYQRNASLLKVATFAKHTRWTRDGPSNLLLPKMIL